MNEIFPVVAGAVLGVLISRLPLPLRTRLIALAALSIALGVVASAISGELALSWEFILIDIPQTLLVAALTFGLATVWQRRAQGVR